MEMNSNKIRLILRIEINFESCDRLNLIFFLKFDGTYVLNWVRMRMNFGERTRRSLILEIKFGKAKMDLEIW